jgi:hypothetical protein
VGNARNLSTVHLYCKSSSVLLRNKKKMQIPVILPALTRLSIFQHSNRETKLDLSRDTNCSYVSAVIYIYGMWRLTALLGKWIAACFFFDCWPSTSTRFILRFLQLSGNTVTQTVGGFGSVSIGSFFQLFTAVCSSYKFTSAKTYIFFLVWRAMSITMPTKCGRQQRTFTL